MSAQTYVNGVVRERWDDASRTYTTYNDAGVQTSSRAYTAAENTATDALIARELLRTNKGTLEQQAVAALASNKAFVAIASPTNAQVAAQVKALTRQNNGLIRLVLGRLEATD